MIKRMIKVLFLSSLLIILFAFLDIVGLVGKLGLFPITHVEFKGGPHVSLQEIQAHCQPIEGRDLLEIHLKPLRKCIERMGWIDTVQLTRTFPGTLEITLTEREPLAMAPLGGHWFYLALGRSFLVGPAFTHSAATYPILNQWEGWTDEKRTLALEVAQSLKKFHITPHVSEIYFHAKKGWVLTFDRGTEVLLGDPVAKENIARLHLVLERFSDLSFHSRQIDMRTEKKIIVKGRNRI